MPCHRGHRKTPRRRCQDKKDTARLALSFLKAGAVCSMFKALSLTSQQLTRRESHDQGAHDDEVGRCCPVWIKTQDPGRHNEPGAKDNVNPLLPPSERRNSSDLDANQ